MVLRILFLTPEQPFTTGNWISARRQAKGLESLGHTVLIVPTGEEGSGLERIVEEFSPMVVNVLHAYRCGKPWLACRHSSRLPWAVTLTGTDVNQGLCDVGQRPTILRIMAEAGAIVTINPLTSEYLSRHFTEWRSKLHHIPPAVDFGRMSYDLRGRWGIAPDTVLFLHPAGIRPVKGNLELLEMFDGVAHSRECRLVFCGPLLDRAYGRDFLQALRERPWALYTGEIEPEAMPDVLRAADVVLNNSSSEGFSNALQEAACLGVPVLARNIPGNRVAFEPGRQGLLYDSEEEFIIKALDLLKHSEVRQRFSQPTESAYCLLEEAAKLEKIYWELMGGNRPGTCWSQAHNHE